MSARERKTEIVCYGPNGRIELPKNFWKDFQRAPGFTIIKTRAPGILKKGACENYTDCLGDISPEDFPVEDNSRYFALERSMGYHCGRCRSPEIRERLLEALQGHPLNGMQLCRILNGAKGEFDINFCREKAGSWRDPNRFKSQGSPYPNCFECSILWSSVYYHLQKLEKAGEVESRVEWRGDPIVPHAKDRMRMWALKGGLPSLDGWTSG